MALILTGSGGLFTRLGHLIYGVSNIMNAYRGDGLADRVALVQADYAATDQNLIDGLYSQLSGAQNTNTGLILPFRSLAQNTVTQMVNNFQPQLRQDYRTALAFLIDYLKDNSETVLRNTVSASVTPGGSNAGNGVVLVGTMSNDGVPQEYMFDEDVGVVITRDAQTGATAGQETFQFSGTYGVSDMMHWLWPQGSNAFASLTAIGAEVSSSAGSRNWLVNGMMESFTANVPDGWHILTGTAGTTILKDSSTYYDGANSFQIVSNGTELTKIRTRFGTDFTSSPVAGDQLAVNLWYKTGATPTGGVLAVYLADGSGTILDDGAGNQSLISVALTGVSNAAWHSLSGFLRLPPILPSTIYLTVGLTSALTLTTTTLNLDRITLARPTPFYAGGPLLACFSGNTPWKLGDVYTIAINNAFNGLMQSGCNQLLNLSGNGLILPSTAGSPTISEGLVA